MIIRILISIICFCAGCIVERILYDRRMTKMISQLDDDGAIYVRDACRNKIKKKRHSNDN